MISSATPSSNDLAIDVRGVDSLRQLARKDPSKAALEVARQFEALLTNQMLKSMREATPKYDEMESGTADMFRGMHDQQLSQMWSKHGGVGFAESIVRQIELQRDPSLYQKPSRALLNDLPAAKAAEVSAKDAGSGDSFVAKQVGNASAASAALGVSAHVLVAHAALESGWGKKPIRDAVGADSHNLFGIKATKDWKGKTTDITTTEFIGGRAQKRVESFRVYDSYAESFNDYASLIKRRYTEAMGQGSNAQGFAKALQTGGYATDPQYANKLTQVAEQLRRQLA
ncbi:flagellar assembly peptidoglycan hydrolase FlgJ [Iodobacter fluviatilis]|jgi:flagellar protein FlgJ|uniref:Peptidoglycan hydrolase FlgJ n=1 Tax=Iodobacter fluviatilis TaxID=537 RepID=A0A7G3GBD1_9NEIS|nr:flagellar assembly peptidoglycan hydrolase FlgJ [Iodobacter fluviatilis]QBC44707.1 flagellar assembly peptidoglycan hydrolase FlgJ [Iodobacter fluviatilis]